MSTTLDLKSQNEMFDNEKPMFPISVIAELLDVHQRTLRIYDEAGLLSPSRSQKNRRLYSLNDIERGKFIQYLTRDLGINLIGVKVISYLLEQRGITSDSHLKHIRETASLLDITPEIQMNNRIKLSKRGRKAKVKE